MACLKRLMKLYAMIIKESHASVAQKSWEENLSAFTSPFTKKQSLSAFFLHYERFFLRIYYLCSQNQWKGTEGIPRSYRRYTEDIKVQHRTTKYATLWHDRTMTIYWA